MIKREVEAKIRAMRKKFPVLWLTGPRQSGKSTLLKTIYSDLPYVSLEDIDSLNFALSDPRAFLEQFPKGAVIDEAQNAPQLFSYIQGIVDSTKAHFALSGSQNFLLSQHISQSLAGRVFILHLLPLSLKELTAAKKTKSSWEDIAFMGGYPRLYNSKIKPTDFFPSYINTYIERDVRQIINVSDLRSFSIFIQLLAGRVGQLINFQSLATDAGISPNTAKSWLSILETSYIIHFLQPHHKNFNKRLIKTPKLYFYDTGLVCSLLNISNADQLKQHFAKGAIFENFVINEYLKSRFNKGLRTNCFFWQSKEKKEIDLLIESGAKTLPFEIKSSVTQQPFLLDNLIYWQKLTNEKAANLSVIFAGSKSFLSTKGNYYTWKDISEIFAKIQ